MHTLFPHHAEPLADFGPMAQVGRLSYLPNRLEMSETSPEVLALRIKNVEDRLAQDLATKLWVRDAVEGAVKPLSDAVTKMAEQQGQLTQTVSGLASKTTEIYSKQDQYARERADRDKAETEERRKQEKEKHEAEMEVLKQQIEDAKNQTWFAVITKKYGPILGVVCATILVLRFMADVLAPTLAMFHK